MANVLRVGRSLVGGPVMLLSTHRLADFWNFYEWWKLVCIKFRWGTGLGERDVWACQLL